MSEQSTRVPSSLTTDGLLGRRYIARFIDTFIIMLLLVLPAVVLGGAVAPQLAGTAPGTLVILVVLLVLWIGYGALLESSRWQATVGKKIMGLRVYNSNGGRLIVMQAGGRNLLKDGPFLLFALIPGGQLLAILWLIVHLVVIHRSPVNQAIHDRIAHSWVAAQEEVTQLRLS